MCVSARARCVRVLVRVCSRVCSRVCWRAQVFGAVSIVPVLVGSLSPERERHYGAIFARPALAIADAPERSPPRMHIPCRRCGTGDDSDLGRARSHAPLEWNLAQVISEGIRAISG